MFRFLLRSSWLSLSLLAMILAAPTAAKSPEEFVGPQPAQDGAPPPPPAGKAALSPQAGKPASETSASAPAPAKAPKAAAAPASPAAPADSAKRTADGSKTVPAKAAPAKAARTAPGPVAAKPTLDTARIHGSYLEGDFDQAIRSLEGALKGRKALDHADSVFIFKHLGVMYAATPATRDKGRYYMLQLISIEPTARILDMYASDMIYLIFRNVQEEYENKHGKMAVAAPADSVPAAPAAAQSEPAPAPVAASSASKRERTLYWAAGGAAVAAGVAGLLFILLDDPQPKKRTIIVKE